MSNLAEKIEQTTIPLERVRRDGGTQPRSELNEEWVDELSEVVARGVQLNAVTVFFDGTDYWLADGFHRCAGYERAGKPEVPYVRIDGTRQDARDYANSGAPNGRHGLRESKADRWRRIENMLRDHPDWSVRQLADHCEVGKSTVDRVREAICPAGTDAAERTVTRNGTTYTMNTGSIGQRESSATPLTPEQEESQSEVMSALFEGEISRDDANDRLAEIDPLWSERAANESEAPPIEEKHVHVSANSGNNEWYTPPEFIELAREAMGGIDTDPATSEFANQAVKAELYFTAETDGRANDWRGNVWMNPPYSQPLISEFCDTAVTKYLAGEIEQACILVNNATETGWFQRLLDGASAVAFLKGRVRYLDSQGNPANTPLQGQAIVYMGRHVDAFASAFSGRGRVLVNG